MHRNHATKQNPSSVHRLQNSLYLLIYRSGALRAQNSCGTITSPDYISGKQSNPHMRNSWPMKHDTHMLGEYRITQSDCGGYQPQHKTALGWQAIKEPQPFIQQARAIIEQHMRNDKLIDVHADDVAQMQISHSFMD